MPIKVNAPVAQMRYLSISDPDGDTYVKVRQPDYAGEVERQGMLERRTMVQDGDWLAQRIEVNMAELWALEIWLTYDETNLELQYTDEKGEIVESVKFEPRDKMSKSEFMRRLVQLPKGIVFEWHNAVIELIPEWSRPF